MNALNEQTGNIALRHTKKNDLEFVLRAERDPQNAPYVGQWEEDQHMDSIAQKDILHLLIEERTTQNSIGYAIIAGLTNTNHSIELRRLVITDKNRGFGKEALTKIIYLAFEQLNAHRLWLDVRVKNQTAQRLYKAAGFVEEGLLRECVAYDGTYESLLVMSLLKNEYDQS